MRISRHLKKQFIENYSSDTNKIFVASLDRRVGKNSNRITANKNNVSDKMAKNQYYSQFCLQFMIKITFICVNFEFWFNSTPFSEHFTLIAERRTQVSFSMATESM